MKYEVDPEHPLTTAFPYFPEDEQAILAGQFKEILATRLSMGPWTARFESSFAEYCGSSFGIAFPSCTAALEASLQALGLEPGDEVLVPVETFIATGMAVHLAGGRPVFTEIDQHSFCMDFEDAWQRVTARTRGAIVVHFGGLVPAGLDRFVRKMRSSGRFVIEDAAHAPGATLNGACAGTFSDAGCFSFYPTKIMTTGEGGMVITRDEKMAGILRSLQQRGRDLEAAGENYVLPGRNNRFTEVAAVMGLSQLRCLKDFLARRREVAATYSRCLQGCTGVEPLALPEGGRPSYWRYTVLLQGKTDRAALKSALAADQIGVDWAYDPPMHLQPVFRRLYQTSPGMLPRSEQLLREHLCLPIHARMRTVDAEYVAERLMFHRSHTAP